MYTGTNPSAIRSQKWLTESLLQLMEEKPYKKISVKEISERSDLARQTFYQLFNSKEEIIEYHLDNLFNNYLKEIKNLKIVSTAELARLYFVFFDTNEKFIYQLIQNDLISILNRKFFSYLSEIKSVLKQEQNIIFNNYASAFISSGLVGILVYWFNENRNLTIDQLALLVSKLLNDNYLDEK
ncbi:TetR/AcrR family transcriptional regulator [Peribacillus loiseleuriae]|uniref:TetR/AcrR family transcriptional regulator n=1 Tax=Peribacillus loiseleuriae TaxID=1679170 RepID=UPI003D062E2F